MAKIFEVDFRTGSLVDRVSGIVPTNTNCILDKGNKGLQANMNTGNLSYTKTLSGSYDVVMAVNYSTKSGIYDYLIDFRTGGGTGYIYNSNPVQISSGTLYIDNILYSSNTQNIKDNKWHLVIVSNMSLVSTIIYLNENQGWGSLSVSKHLFCKLYDHRLTEQERASIYKDFLNSYPQGKEKYPNVVNKPLDLSREKNNTLGSDIVVNGGFDTDSVWGKELGWTINDGKAIGTNPSNAAIYQSFVWDITKQYKLDFDLTITSGSLAFQKGSGGLIEYYTTSGHKTLIWTPGAGYDYIAFAERSSTGFIGTIDNIQIRPYTGLVAAYNMIPSGSTLVDISGNGKNGTISNCVSLKDGIKFIKEKLSKITFASALCGVPSSISLRFETPSVIASEEKAIIGQGVGYPYIILSNGVLNCGYYVGSWVSKVKSNITLLANSKYTITFTCNTNEGKLYVNGVDVSTTGENISVPTPVILMNDIGNGWSSSGNIYDLRCYNKILSLAEHKNYHNSFVQPTLVEDFSSEGADGVAKVPSGWLRSSGAFKIGEVAKMTNTELVDNGGFDSETGWTLNPSWTIANGVAHYDNVTTTQSMWNTAQTFTVGKTYQISFDISNCAGSALLRFYGAAPGGDIFEYLGYPNGHNSFIKTATLTTVGLRLMGMQGQSFDLDNLSIKEVTLPTLQNGSKYLECITAGTIAIPSKQAYGTWEFDWYKGATTEPIYSFIANNLKPYGYNNGYSILPYTTRFYFSNGTVYLGYTNINVITSNTWYRFKITRSTSGVFTLYIKGGTFGTNSWTLVSTVGGAGTNPVTDNTYTTSEYFVLDIDAGDCITNIQLWDGIKQ